jgi:hypothetical protein
MKFRHHASASWQANPEKALNEGETPARQDMKLPNWGAMPTKGTWHKSCKSSFRPKHTLNAEITHAEENSLSNGRRRGQTHPLTTTTSGDDHENGDCHRQAFQA